MAFDKKKVFSFAGFPDPLATDEVKKKNEYGLQAAKAIEYQWFYRPENSNGVCNYYDKRDKYHQLRLYARGEQSSKLYKDLMNGGEDTSYTNYDWRALQIIPKFVKLITNQMSERLFDIKAEAIDKFSTDLKDTHRRNLENIVYARPAMEAAKKTLGVDIMPKDIDDYPETQEEIDLFMQLKYKPAIEIASEEAIKYTLELNDYKETQGRVIEDITTLGLAAIKHNTDPVKGIEVEYVDPADIVYSYPTHRDFKDVNYYGEVKRITINELKRISGKKFTDEELQNIADSTSQWTRYHGSSTNQQSYREDDIQGMMVDVLFFTFKSTNTLNYKKKKLSNGGFKMTERESDFIKSNPNYDGYDVVKKTIDVWYEGSLILGTDMLFNYKLCENMIRPDGYLNRTAANYVMYAPELYQNRTKSLVERIIPYVDEMQQIHIKLQQIIAKARPNGIYIDVAGLNEINMGEGNMLTPLEAIKIYDQTGNVLGSSLTHEGDYNYGREPIKELKNGVIDGLDRLIGAYNHYLNLLRDAIGIPQGADASTPHPDMAVGVQRQLAMNSNTATRHILDGTLNMSERLGKGLLLRIKDIFLYSNLKEAYINAIGKINVNVLEALKRYHLHDLGINITLKPDSEERQYLEQNIQIAIDRDLIKLDDAIDIRNIGNTKLANELIKTRRIRREKAKIENDKQMEQLRAEGQAMVAERASQAKSQEMQIKAQTDLQVVNAKSQAKQQELVTEAKLKSELMQQEFNYNMQLQGIKVQADTFKTKFLEDSKTKRQDRGKSQDSKLIQQRTFNEPSKNFESSEDNLSGSMEMAEMDVT